jgi:hypothetical protein
MTGERKAFEAWAAERGWPLHKVSDSVYADRDTGNVWVGWKARGAQQEHVTEDMIEAGINNAGGGGSMRDWCINVYKAMIAAQEKP